MKITYEQPSAPLPLPVETIEIVQPNIRGNYEAGKIIQVRPRTYGPSSENAGVVLKGLGDDRDYHFYIALDLERTKELRVALDILIDQLS